MLDAVAEADVIDEVSRDGRSRMSCKEDAELDKSRDCFRDCRRLFEGSSLGPGSAVRARE